MSEPEEVGLYLKGEFEQTCGFCGCVFNVEVPGRVRNEGPETYFCPECNKRYLSKAAAVPRVKLISERTDGLTKKYNNS